MRSKVREPSEHEAAMVEVLEEVVGFGDQGGRTLREWDNLVNRAKELLKPRSQDSWEVYSDPREETFVRSAYPIFESDYNGEEIGLFYELKDAKIAAASHELLRALVGLYNHTKNNHNLAGLNAAAGEAITKAVGDAEYTALLER